MSLLLLVNASACTEYVPMRGALDRAAAPEVRVTLTEQGGLDFATRIGPRAQRLEGILGGMTDSSLTLSVRKVWRQGGIQDTYAGEQLVLSTGGFELVEKPRTSARRTALLAGGVIAGALLIARGAGSLSGDDPGGKRPPSR